MIRTSFNAGWEVRGKVNPFAEMSGATVPFRPVTLPHDAMLTRDRVRPDTGAASEAGATAYFPGGTYEYRKTFAVPGELRDKRVILQFDGVFRDAVVTVNGNYAGQRPYGYSRFFIDAGRFLNFGQDNEIRVEARSGQDARWYSGAGIYRDTWLLVGDLVHIEPEGVRVSTPDIEPGRAVVEVATTVANDSITVRTVEVITEIRDQADVVVAVDTSRITVAPGEPAIARQRLYLRDPALWSPDSPALQTCRVRLGDIDSEQVRFGVRKLQLDPDRGLRINGETVKLRGACIHHDNGPLGAATFARAEERRVEILKAAGFNALRMAHHPMSTALLDACDRLGMLVMDEAFDVWTSGKNPLDYSLSFPEWWERDIEAMVAKDHNHPSVVLYSIGNEIPEIATPAGNVWGRRLAEKIRALDPTRYVTNGVNNLLAVAADRDALRAEIQREIADDTGINTLMTDMGEAMNRAAAARIVTERTTESYAMLDIAGMNYSESRYELDKELFPNRIILGTETFPPHIDRNWRLVTRHPHVIGDFTWTGWDYLGEVGAGRPQYGSQGGPTFTAPYPYLVAGTGDIDITGHRRPVSYYREIVFGRRAEPYLAVWRPEHHGQPYTAGPWAWSDTLASWTWPGFENAPVTVEVYSDADEVELVLNGRCIGRRPVGADHRFRAGFETRYEPGELVAIAYRAGAETGRTGLRTATGPVLLRAEADRPVVTTAPGDLAYVTLTLTDAHGALNPAADRPVHIDVSGDGALLGFGSAAPSTVERFDAVERRTYEGRAICVIRPGKPGKIRLTASAPDCDPVDIVIAVEESK